MAHSTAPHHRPVTTSVIVFPKLQKPKETLSAARVLLWLRRRRGLVRPSKGCSIKLKVRPMGRQAITPPQAIRAKAAAADQLAILRCRRKGRNWLCRCADSEGSRFEAAPAVADWPGGDGRSTTTSQWRARGRPRSSECWTGVRRRTGLTAGSATPCSAGDGGAEPRAVRGPRWQAAELRGAGRCGTGAAVMTCVQRGCQRTVESLPSTERLSGRATNCGTGAAVMMCVQRVCQRTVFL